MNVKREIQAILESGESHETLLERVHAFEAQGITAQELYSELEQIWLDFGFDAKDEGGRLQENLEYIMEKVWYQGASK